MRILLSIVIGICLASLSATHHATTLAADPVNLRLGLQELSCDASGSVDAVFSVPWNGALSRNGTVPLPDEIWIDLSLQDNGFAPGTFLGSGPYRSVASANVIRWTGLVVDRPHFYRLNARYGSAWRQFDGGHFDTPDCTVVRAMSCEGSGSTIAVTFWVPAAGILEHAAPRETWLDISTMPDGFATGAFVGAGPFPVSPDRPVQFVWSGISIGWRHYYRTNTRFEPFGWVTQRGGSFLALGCNTLLRVAD